MAKPSLKKNTKPPKVVKPKLSRAAIKSIDDKYCGPEPLSVDTSDFSRYRDALNWYNYMHDHEQAREWLLEYMKKNGFDRAQIASVRRVPKYSVPTTIGWQSRIMMNGNVLSESSMNFFNDRLNSLFRMGESIKEEAEVKTDRPVVSIQERVQAKIQQLITDCEEAFDEDPKFNVYEWLQGKEASAQAAAAIRDYYLPCLQEIIDGGDDIKEAYGKKQKYWLDIFKGIVDDCDRYCGNKKATKVRKPREKKVKSAVDQVSKLKYQKEFPQLKIVSVNPAEIVGCKQLWTYNTKYRKLTRFDASGPNGIQVKGTTLIGFDVETSLTKRLRKPDTALQSLLSAGKVALRTFMDTIKSIDSKPTGRINTDTIILRVIK